MAPLPVSRELTNMSLSFGADNTLALAEISAKLQEYNIGMMGASTSFYAGRIGVNSIVKDNSGSWYDSIMAWISN